MNKKLLKIITGIAVAGAALGAAFAYVKKCKEVNDLGEEDFDDPVGRRRRKKSRSQQLHTMPQLHHHSFRYSGSGG